MAHFSVRWSSDRCDPRSSHWFVLNGTITYASYVLRNWVGRRHVQLCQHLYDKGYHVQYLDPHCVPPTQKYHKEMLSTVEALLDMMERQP